MSDNSVIVPIKDPDRGFRTWHIDEIYDGQGPGRYVPNVDDMVWSWVQGAYRVTDVDYTTCHSTLAKYEPPKDPEVVGEDDVLLGGGPGFQSESYRVYVDDSVTPHTLAVDARCRIYNPTVTGYKLFKGNDYGSDGKVISRRYDQNGTYLGELLPLEPLNDEEDGSLVGLSPAVGYTIDSLEDGEPVTAVFYNPEGSAVSIARLLVKKTAFIRQAYANQKYITGIRIESPFISDADPKTLEYPINMPVQALAMMGVVTYSDGGSKRIPIDGEKFILHGLDTFIPTILGQKIPLVLTYRLSAGEAAYDAQNGAVTHVSESYHAKTVEVDGAYSVKLFVYPTWIDSANGYRLEYFLYNLDREEVYDATPFVRLATNSPSYNPTLYGQVQNLTLSVNLNEVNGQFSSYRHVQTVGVTLREEGDIDAANWEIQYTPNQEPIFGGVGMAAHFEFVNTEYHRLDISLEAGSKEDWLSKIYEPTQPLYNPRIEAEPPRPTHFKLYFNNRRIEYTIDQWDAELEVPNDLSEGETLYVEFIKRTAQTDLQLAIAGLPMHQIVYG